MNWGIFRSRIEFLVLENDFNLCVIEVKRALLEEHLWQLFASLFIAFHQNESNQAVYGILTDTQRWKFCRMSKKGRTFVFELSKEIILLTIHPATRQHSFTSLACLKSLLFYFDLIFDWRRHNP